MTPSAGINKTDQTLQLELRLVRYDKQNKPQTYAAIGGVPFTEKEIEGADGRIRARLFLDQLISQAISRINGSAEPLPRSKNSMKGITILQFEKILELLKAGSLKQSQVTAFDLNKHIKVIRLELVKEPVK